MNLRLRVAIAWICVSAMFIRTHISALMTYALHKLVNLTVSVGQAREKRRFKPYKEATDNLRERMNSLMLEFRSIDPLTDERKRQLLAAKSSLLKESDSLLSICKNWTSVPPPGATVLMYVLEHERTKHVRRHRSAQSFSIIVSRISSETFYWDLLLWVAGCREEMLGDLNERYLLRISTHGKAGALAWYCDQAIRTIRDYVWTKIERLAAIGALIDLISRWFKK